MHDPWKNRRIHAVDGPCGKKTNLQESGFQGLCEVLGISEAMHLTLTIMSDANMLEY